MTLSEFPRSARAHLTLGASATGKTARLVESLKRLEGEQGVSSDQILVVAATPEGALDLAERIERSLPQAGIAVKTAREAALDVLSSPSAQAFTGRKPRLLSRFETSFLMEDMKTCGLRPRRINELVHFFYRSWTELADFQDGWLVYKEEEQTHALLKSLLGSYKAYVEPELANQAVRYLGQDAAALAGNARAYVFVDDYQLLSRADQYLVNLLAGKELYVYANPGVNPQVYDSYPYAGGVNELAQRGNVAERLELTQSQLPADTLGALQKLAPLTAAADGRNDSGQSAAESDAAAKHEGQAGAEELLRRAEPARKEDGVRIVTCDDPASEMQAVAQWASDLAAQGFAPQDMAVIAPNRTWERNVRRALAQAGIETQGSSVQNAIGGDIRVRELCRPARLVTLLRLAADPEDEPALRAWCGFGDELAIRQLFHELFALAREDGQNLHAVVDRVAREASDSAIEDDERVTFKSEAYKLAGALHELQQHLEALNGLTGRSLVEKAMELVGIDAATPRIARLFTGTEDSDDAAAVVRKAEHEALFGALSANGTVRVVSVQRTAGLHVRAVAATGMVSGFTPKHVYFDRTKKSPEQAARMLGRDAEAYIEALGKGIDRCALFAFAQMPGADAEAHDVRVDRFFAKDGKRWGQVHQSLLIDQIEGKEFADTIW